MQEARPLWLSCCSTPYSFRPTLPCRQPGLSGDPAALHPLLSLIHTHSATLLCGQIDLSSGPAAPRPLLSLLHVRAGSQASLVFQLLCALIFPSNPTQPHFPVCSQASLEAPLFCTVLSPSSTSTQPPVASALLSLSLCPLPRPSAPSDPYRSFRGLGTSLSLCSKPPHPIFQPEVPEVLVDSVLLSPSAHQPAIHRLP